MQLQLEVKETGEATYLVSKKQQTKYRVTYLEVWKWENKSDWCFECQRTAWKVNVTVLEVVNQEKGCAWYI